LQVLRFSQDVGVSTPKVAEEAFALRYCDSARNAFKGDASLVEDMGQVAFASLTFNVRQAHITQG
jgi:hypothetical protein